MSRLLLISLSIVISVAFEKSIFVSSRQTLRSETTFDELEGSSRQKVERNRAAEERINLSFPGTKWCGPGNTADAYDDLGSDPEVDKCCRAHDHCDNIPSGEEKNGLKNTDYFTRLHCLCDKEFKQCLKNVNSRRGNYIGNFYFNLRDRCYKEHHPIVECDETHTKIFVRRCIRYMIDVKQPRVWQWFDLPFYDDEHDFEFVDDKQTRDFVEENELLLRNFV